MSSGFFTAPFLARRTTHGVVYTFFCELSGAPVFETAPILALDPRRAGKLACEQARPHFNRCTRCGRWVADTAYNIDEMQCVECAPHRFPPKYCPACGSPIPTENQYCTRCGRRLSLPLASG